MKISLAQMLAQIPGPASKEWPEGERYVEALAHGSMRVGLYAPVARDPQSPHSQDELYIVLSGGAEFVRADESELCVAGDVLFVAAGVAHRFLHPSSDFSAWVVFWGPKGGERQS